MPAVRCVVPRCKGKVTDKVAIASGPDSYVYAPLCHEHVVAINDPDVAFDAGRVATILALREEMA